MKRLLLAFAGTWVVSAASVTLIERQTNNSASSNSSSPAPGAQSEQTSPPFYPSPWIDSTTVGWQDAIAEAQAFVKQLTLLEKVNLTTGVGWEGEACVGNVGAIPRLGFPSLCMQDSPLGIRNTDYNSAFPAGGTVAASWDRGVWYQRGNDMGSEFRDKGIDVQLGPVVGPLGRSPEGGRNWEGFSPDPVLSGIAVAQTVKGIQAAGVVACTKHYIGNEQERFRQQPEAQGYGFDINEALSSNIDDITLHELYLWPFADAVRAGTGSIMCSYNQVNNSYGCQNSYLLNGILKGELGFQGFVMSDWQAQHAGVATSLAGLDMSMPGDTVFNTGVSYWGANLTRAVLNGTIPEWRIDDMATRIMAAYYLVGRDKVSVPTNFQTWNRATFGLFHVQPNASDAYGLINQHVDVRAEHGRNIRDHAAKSTVLLKNVDGTLPLTGKEKFTGVFGEDADVSSWGPNGSPDRGSDNGTLAMGWGSGTAEFPYLVGPLTAIQNEVASHYGVIQSVTNNWAYGQIAKVAGQATVSIVFVNADSGEGYISVDGNEGDRKNLTLWRNGDTLIQNVTRRSNNTIVVIHSVGPVLIDAWYNNPNITAILWAGLPGEQSGNSIADILYGRINPGGKLPFTLAKTAQDYGTGLLREPNNGKGAPQDNFVEGNFIDYRRFDKEGIEPIYEFGYGLSYTSFAYSNLQITPHAFTPYVPTTGETGPAPVLGTYSNNTADYEFPANFTKVGLYIYPYLNSSTVFENDSPEVPLGSTDGSPQSKIPAGGAPGGNPALYDVLFTVSATIANTGRITGEEVAQLYVSLGGPSDPLRVLRGFDRLSIAAGGSTTFSVDLTRRDLSNWDPVSQNWVITRYHKNVYVGASSRNLPLNGTLTFSGSGYGGQ
ncbi:putative beta-glucosidase 1 precursor [Tothia fuscella]|uniref:beta-glucosidase n=1 Tax=Tothia fuscella TaxID=1048955 RepID=A0A9P4U0X3_9PEZI|nr:putative beta-glucosidase 1 precursor [Tothia fuscella]